MLALGPLSFAAPWMLLGLAALPAIWWLLRISPPLPKRVRFPAIRLLVGLVREEDTPAHTPLWLLILRMTIAALIVLALAEPVLNPAKPAAGSGPLVIIVDNGWASAARWSERRFTMDGLIADARRADRSVLVAGTAPEIVPPALNFESAGDANARARAIEPQPIEPDRIALVERLEGAAVLARGAEIVWISDGLDYGAAAQFAGRLGALAGSGGLTLIEPALGKRALALLPPERDAGGIVPRVLRAEGTGAREGALRALDNEGNVLGEARFALADGEVLAPVPFDLPLELRNRISRLEIAGEASAGAVVLADESWRRRNVGIVSGASAEEAQPLLSDIYYVRRALAPYVELRNTTDERNAEAAIEELLSAPLSVLILADIGNLTEPTRERIDAWVANGGMLIRFAGPRLAEHGDELVPVPLRTGGRALGGALSWSTPQSLAPFEEDSPFFGIDVPEDVSVSRQVLAEPMPDLARHTWARLTDRTPLVTAAQRGRGAIVLFHVTANRDWSSLPISGLFVEMLRRAVELSQGSVAQSSNGDAGGARERQMLSPLTTLNGFGRLGTPPATATPIAAERLTSAERSPRHPPGFYGLAGAPRALNLATVDYELRPLGDVPGVSERLSFEGGPELRLAAILLVLALFLVVLDTLAALWVTGLFETEKIRRVRFASRAAPALLALLLVLPVTDALAQENDAFALKATLETPLAYVITGDSELDAVSEAGLFALAQALRARTAFEAAEPMAVDVERDELAFFPLLYWPMSGMQPDLSPQALGKINTYMKNGGTILFDTRDGDRAAGGGEVPPGTAALRRLLGQLDLPPLEPVPADHVLTKSFYLMQSFPGRFDNGELWVEARSGDEELLVNDGVSTVIIGANDFAAAWARDANGRALYAVTPGGERQREMAYRFGVNLVIYALTGNYKADQVHVPALLERLGQ